MKMLRMDVESSYEISKLVHLLNAVRLLAPEEKTLLRCIAELALAGEGRMISGSIYKGVKDRMSMRYTTFYERLKKFSRMRLIEVRPPRIRGNTREIVLRYDPARVIEACG